MVNQHMLALGQTRSCIRELFEYGLRQKAAGETVYDFSIGNPSIPAPPEVNEAFASILQNTDSLTIHGYTQAPGAMDARQAVAEELNRRYGADLRGENIFFTCAALEERVTARTQAVIVNSPNNPSGVIYTRAALERLAEVLARKSVEAGHPI